jgi:hypothetical protein
VREIIDQLPAGIEALHALVLTAWTQRWAARAERDTAIGKRDRALSPIDRLRHLLTPMPLNDHGSWEAGVDRVKLGIVMRNVPWLTIPIARSSTQAKLGTWGLWLQSAKKSRSLTEHCEDCVHWNRINGESHGTSISARGLAWFSRRRWRTDLSL